MPLLCHYYRWFKIEEDLGELMSGVFFMEFSIYLVYFSACHVYWLILIVICPTASWVFQGSAPDIGGPQANTANLGIELRIRLEGVGSWSDRCGPIP